MARIPFTEAERREIGAILAMRENATGPLCRPLGNWLVDRAMRTWPRRAGLRIWSKTNDRRRWTLVSFHHPARLCWSWSLSLALFPSWGGYKSLRHIWGSYRGNWRFCIPLLFEISWHRQTYDWMLSRNAERRLHALAMYDRSEELERVLGGGAA